VESGKLELDKKTQFSQGVPQFS